MIKFYKIIVIVGLLFVSCSEGSSSEDLPTVPEETEPIIPSDLSLTITIEGATTDSPEGDGSGVIKCVASATDAVKYGFRLGTGAEVESVTGEIEHVYTRKGTSTYTVYVYAYSSTGDYINTSKSISVKVSNNFNKLVWSDEFDVDGSPDDSKWSFEIGTGSNGWGNGEKEYYTDRSENVIVEDGMLKITAIKENYEGAEYTSTRMKTQGKYDFTYGKIQVRAKLPFGKGTWPAIWMLGANKDEVGWPACGEIDIMEHWGHEQGSAHSTVHTTSTKQEGAITPGSRFLDDISTAFHIYELEWDEEQLVFSVDGEETLTYKPSVYNSDTWPFTTGQFIILNVAMGGVWFDIDPDFQQSTMEVDYVRVYQKE